MKIAKNKSNMAQVQNSGLPKYSQQRTINLNFIDELNIGLENGGTDGNLNYDTASVSQNNNGKPDKWFQDPNFSVIYKNPKGSEFIDNGEYEDSREIDTPQNLSSHREKIKLPLHNASQAQSPVLYSTIASPDQRGVTIKHEEQTDTGEQLREEINSALDMAGIMQRSLGSKQSNAEYNTQNQDSEADQFIPKISLLSQNRQLQEPQTAQLHHLKPNLLAKPPSRRQIKQSQSPSSQSRKGGRTRENSRIIERLQKKFENSILHVDADQDNSDIFKRFELDMISKPQQDERRARQMIINKLQDFQNKRRGVDDSFFMIVDKLPIERIEDMNGRFSKVTRCLCKTRININHLAATIIKSKIFEAISLLVIVGNSISLAIEDPTDKTPEAFQESLDTVFLVLYSVEMGLKILGLGFVFNQGAYLRDTWNILDFTIVMVGYLQLVLQGSSFNLSGLRAFRVLRPLKSISSIEGLKGIVSALLSSLPLLRDTAIVLLFFFFIFAIAGLQLFQGYLKKRCVHIETGVPHVDDDFCGFKDCDPGYFCGKRNENPNYGQTNFDTIFYALIAIFTSVTLEGWTYVMGAIDKSFTNISFIFFIPLVFIGAFFLMNLTLAVIKSKFSKQHEERKKEKLQGLSKSKAKAEDYVGHEHLKEEDQKKRQAEELKVRNQVLQKWRMILFIKERIRNRIKAFKEKRINETQIKNKTTNASTRLEGGQTKFIDYGQLFSGSDQINENMDSQMNHSARLMDQDGGSSSQRQLLQSQRISQQIQLTQLSDEKVPNPAPSNIKQNNGNKLNIHNLRQLDQDAIKEEDDEYKTEFSNIIGSLKHVNGHHLSSKNVRNGSNGSKSTPKSNSNQDMISRRSSSKLNFQNQIQFLQSLQERPQSQDIIISSPEKKMKLLGMQGFKKQRKAKSKEPQSTTNKTSSQPATSSNKHNKKAIILNEQFFVEFINNDFQVLEQVFSEQQLRAIAEQVEDPQNYENSTSKLLDIVDDDALNAIADQLSEASIITDDYYTNNNNLRKSKKNPQGSLQSVIGMTGDNNNDDRNQTPYTSTTALGVQYVKGNGNTFHRQRSKNTQHYFMSQDLSISDIYETNGGQEQFVNQNYENANESPQTYQSLSNDIMNSNEIPLNRQITDLTTKTHEYIHNNKTARGVSAGELQEKKIANLVKNKKGENANAISHNLSQSNITTINQNGTIQSEATGMIAIGSKAKTADFYTMRKKMGSAKIIPYEINSFDPLTAERLQRARHGTQTISNQDDIPVEQSVLNSRFLISHHLQKHQKVYLRKEKFDFQKSSDDIFEQRNRSNKEKSRSEKRIAATAYGKNWKIKPYQKKMKYTPKIYKPDDDQIEYMQHLGLEANELHILIQQQYDEAYITNLYVTGTLSIAIHDKKDVQQNKTRKIQSQYLQQSNIDEQQEEQSLSHSMSMNYNQLGTNNSIQPMSPSMKRSKTMVKSAPQKTHMRILAPHEQLNHDLKTSIFMKATSNPTLSKSKKAKRIGTSHSGMTDLRKRMTTTNEVQSVDRRAMLLKKQAAKDPKLQKKLILSGLNKDAYRSNLFRMLLITRKNRITQEELEKNPHILGMLDIYEGEEEEEESDEDNEESDSDGDEIKDDFLDWPIECKVEVLKAKKSAIATNKNYVQWSGQDVLTDFDPGHAFTAMRQISEVRIWPKQLYGVWKKFRVPLKNFVKGSFFDNLMTLAVTVNTVALALDKYGIDPEMAANLSTMNTVFTWFFIGEMSLKIIGLGVLKYFKDRMNYLDCIVVMLSIVEMSFLSNSGTNLSAFRSIRIFRTFRVLRVARLLKSMQSMQVIMSVLVRSMDSFIYLALLLLLFIFIFALLGMQIFGDNFNFDSNFYGPPGVPRTNYNSFHSAFLTTFQIVTLEGWPALFYDALRSPVASPISALYFITWVFLGNFMLLNLFLAILLDSFTSEAPHKKNEEEESEKEIKKKHLEELEKKEGQELIEYYQEEKVNGNHGDKKKAVQIGGKKKKKKKKKDENMLDESFEYDNKDILTKKTVIKKAKVDFEGVSCDRSFYILSKKNKLRIYLFRAVTHTGFETVILILIILSSIKLVIDTYIFDLPDDDPLQLASKNIDFFFTAVFALESLLKALAFGFIQDGGSYLRETWSQMDFFIVTTSIIDASFENINLPIIKILRLLRTLRPLRFISHNSGMKTIVVALLGSVGGIINVLIVVVVVWMMFAILAVNFFGGKMQYCTIDTFLMQTKKECLQNRGQWKTYDYNFDSVPTAMITLFALATLENWPDVMYNAINIGGLNLGPVFNDTPQNGYFFVIYILIGSFLFLNLFVGVIFKEFEDAQEEEKSSMMLKEHQMKWVDMMKMIVNSKPDLETTNRPKQKWRAKVHSFMTGADRPINYVDIFVMACIVLNMFQMAVNFEGSSVEYNNALDYINYFFTGVFALECILKLIAFDLSYFRSSWNVFDFCVVLASGLDIVMNQMSSTSLKFLRVGPQLARVMRVLRVSRLFRLINKYKGLQALIQTIQFSLPSLFNVFSLLMLVYFIFAVLGTFLFRGVTEGVVINEYNNFTNFSYAMMTLIRMSTGEDWNYIMFDCMRTADDGCIEGRTCGLSYAPVFFIPYMMISTFIMLNLFILVIIQQFELYYLQEDNVLEKFKDNLELFKKTWTKFTKDQNCLKLKDTKLVSFFRSMDPPLGMSDKTDKDIIKNVVLMELVSDEEGFVYFNELLFRSMRRVYGESRVKNKILVEHELKAMKRIEEIKHKMKKKSWKQERTNAIQVNPFMLQMYMNISFKAWLKQYKAYADKRAAENQYISMAEGVIDVDGQKKFDLISEESQVIDGVPGPDGIIQGSEKKVEEDEWEYKTEQDIECSSGEQSYYEEDDDNQYGDENEFDNEEDQQENSRFLRHQTQVKAIDIVTLRTRKIASQTQGNSPTNSPGLSTFAKKETDQKSLSSHNKSHLVINQQQVENLHGNPSNVNSLHNSQLAINDSVQPPSKRLSSKSNAASNLHIEIPPKKRQSNSQQPPVVRVDSNKNIINKDAQNQQFQFAIDLKDIIDGTNINNQPSSPLESKHSPSQSQQQLRTSGYNSNRKRDNVMISSRSGSSMDVDHVGGNEALINNLKAQSDQIVLLKINMDSQNAQSSRSHGSNASHHVQQKQDEEQEEQQQEE